LPPPADVSDGVFPPLLFAYAKSFLILATCSLNSS